MNAAQDTTGPSPTDDSTRAALLVIGGGPAGLAAATAYRDHGGQGEVVLVSDDDTAPYLRPPLSKDYLQGETAEPDLALAPESDYAEKSITLRLDTMVTAISADEGRARLSDGTQIAFDRCVIATGNAPVTLPVPGADDPRVAYLRSLEQARRLREEAGTARSAVVVGSGFIGCEAAVTLARRGLEVTVCSTEEIPQAQRLGTDAGERIAGWLREEGVRLLGGVEVTAITDGRRVELDEGGPLEADLVLVAAGATPRSTLAVAAGIPAEQGRVLVDEHMASEVPRVFAAGDVAMAYNTGAGRHLAVEHWGEAEAMGTIAGTTAAGGDASWDSPPGFWTVIGDHTLKYAAWGDGYDRAELVDHGDGAFTVWYSTDGVLVGVATHDADDDYESGGQAVLRGDRADPAVSAGTGS
ncbi:pyridine nucleotide-disulfide oxidoreductase [Pseudonocardia sediminis]|uniref:Pyridine nucleotide-disulfide oxidoreductase n=1 Tax=Pseudonocardia sediminis TaxID=1397368 RepID=A0A4Q7UYT0_PSEST|nr:FAD-dependent oxidoreductase [Pseudonocardia sediminis]RZT87252.1 pyridine nucleotide-disulfide oxidoreductase [Pseudonocardia sediminis]